MSAELAASTALFTAFRIRLLTTVLYPASDALVAKARRGRPRMLVGPAQRRDDPDEQRIVQIAARQRRHAQVVESIRRTRQRNRQSASCLAAGPRRWRPRSVRSPPAPRTRNAAG